MASRPAIGQSQSDLRAVRMLRDCGVVRATSGGGPLRELFDNGDADCREVPDRDDVVDYFLTESGRGVARAKLKDH